MKSFWHVNEQEKNSPAGRAFASMEKTFLLEGDRIAEDPLSIVLRVKVSGLFYYVKKYHQGGKWMRRYIGRSRVRAEWENLKYLALQGIPTPQLIAYGQKSRWGIFQCGAIVTKEILNTVDLAKLVSKKSALINDPIWFRQVAGQVAVFTRRMHDSGFIHNDLKWRNILVTPEQTAKVYFIDCPSGRKKTGFVRKRWIVKDLACLDKVAKYNLSMSKRLWFYKQYSGHKKITPKDKRIIKDVITFFKGRE